MKKILFLFLVLCCGVAFADTINLHWLNDDGTTYQNSTCTVDGDLILPTPPTKYGYTFTGWKIASYVPVEYLESTGSQWIDTGYIFNTNNVRLIIKWSNSSSNKTAQVLFGGYNPVSLRSILPCIRPNGNKMEIQVAGTLPAPFTYTIETPHTIDVTIESNIVTYKVTDINQSARFSYSGNFNKTESNFLFAFNSSNNPSDLFTGKIYSFQLYDNNTLVRDFIPVLDPAGTPCMFDRVESKFYYNQGTGDFIAGPVVSE